uniref:Immunoglobulin domain-containing protein n=1 Tax=Gasterosteus aculeatus aculeatus TaxID=481459 RepID=A0AAQ4QQR4_GASAC
MKLQTYLILFLQVVLVKCLPDISGFLGGNVTLPSGVDPSWELSSIVWTIFLNSTWIATYRNKWKNLDHLARYKGRLGLNSSTGDLTIHHLTLEDALQYTVALTGTPGQKSLNKVTVRVTSKCNGSRYVFESKSNKCHWSVRCESTDEGVLLSLEATPPAVTSGCNLTDTNGHSVALLYIRGSTQHPVEVTCTSHRGEEKASSSVKATCSGETRYLLAFLLGLMTGILLLVGALCLSNHYRGNKNECI